MHVRMQPVHDRHQGRINVRKLRHKVERIIESPGMYVIAIDRITGNARNAKKKREREKGADTQIGCELDASKAKYYAVPFNLMNKQKTHACNFRKRNEMYL